MSDGVVLFLLSKVTVGKGVNIDLQNRKNIEKFNVL